MSEEQSYPSRTLTIIKVDDWALLFSDDHFCTEGHEITLDDLEDKTRWGPAFIRVISGDGTRLETYLQEHGGWDGHGLSTVMAMLIKSK